MLCATSDSYTARACGRYIGYGPAPACPPSGFHSYGECRFRSIENAGATALVKPS